MAIDTSSRALAAGIRGGIVTAIAIIALCGLAACSGGNEGGDLFHAGSVSASRLEASVSYSEGMIRLDPPASSQTPTVSAGDAYQLGVSSGWYAGVPAGEKPMIEFGLYTDYGDGSAGADGKVTPFLVNVPVWAVVFTDVPMSGRGGAYLSGQPRSSAPPVLEDLVSIVDATTGKSISLMNDLPDATTRMTPPVDQ
jgi:hypothetical protein